MSLRTTLRTRPNRLGLCSPGAAGAGVGGAIGVAAGSDMNGTKARNPGGCQGKYSHHDLSQSTRPAQARRRRAERRTALIAASPAILSVVSFRNRNPLKKLGRAECPKVLTYAPSAVGQKLTSTRADTRGQGFWAKGCNPLTPA